MHEGSDGRRSREAGAREAGTRAILDTLAAGDPNDFPSFRELLAGLERRAFGMLLLVSVLPAFIPIPIGGAISGPLAMLIGAQLCGLMRKPWLPEFIAKRGMHRHAFTRFDTRISPALARLEHLIRPRLAWMLDSPVASIITGLLLLLLGFLLSLPIPLTNYVFGALLLAMALALLERDGALMLAAWVAGAVAVGSFGVLSGTLAEQAARGIDLLF